MKTAVLHIGLPKTGTTAIQHMLFEAARSGALPGVDYPLPYADSMHSQHLLWALFRRDKPLSRWPQFELERRGASAAVLPVLEQCWARIADASNLLLSSEYFSIWSDDEVEVLAAALRAAGFARVHVLVYVREPAQAYLSMAQQQIRAASRFPLPQEYSTHYRRAVQRFVTHFGDVEVRVFDRRQLFEGCAVRDFASVLERKFGLSLAHDRLTVGNANDTLSAEAMLLLHEWRRTHFAGIEAVTAEGNRLVRLLLASRALIPQTAPSLRPSVARTVRAAHADEIAYLRDLGVQFRSDDSDGAHDTDGEVSDDDIGSILAHHDPAVLAALRAHVQASFDPAVPGSPVPARSEAVHAAHLDDDIWRCLHTHDCELHFIGASVTAQKASWAAELHAELVALTGRAHTITKTAMGGVGILFGLGFFASAGAKPRIAFIEFSTGDFNVGLSPPQELGWMIEALVARARAEGGQVVVVHNWRADNRGDADKKGVFAAYDAVTNRLAVPTVYNNRWVDTQLAADASQQERLFRDVCHTTAEGAASYARHVLAALRAAPPRSAATVAEPARLPADWPAVLQLVPAMLHGPAPQRDYEYPSTGQQIAFHELPVGSRAAVRLTGRLMGLGFISGPRSGWAGVFVDGKLQRRFRCFDQHSHYERYILLPLFMDLQGAMLEVRLLDDPVDFSLARTRHADFDAPRCVMLAHFVGTFSGAEPIP